MSIPVINAEGNDLAGISYFDMEELFLEDQMPETSIPFVSPFSVSTPINLSNEVHQLSEDGIPKDQMPKTSIPLVLSPSIISSRHDSLPSTSTSTSKHSSTRTSVSSRSSVEDILNSVTRFNTSNTSNCSEVKSVKVRKKLHLPSVMTCQRWIDLKKAHENEKNEAKAKKKHKKKQERELKQEVNRLHTEIFNFFLFRK